MDYSGPDDTRYEVAPNSQGELSRGETFFRVQGPTNIKVELGRRHISSTSTSVVTVSHYIVGLLSMIMRQGP